MPRSPFRVIYPSVLRAYRLFTLAILALVISMTACKPAASGLEAGFLRPPDSAKPRVYWWWLFNRVDKAAITRDLEEFKAKGIQGVNLICTGGYAGLAPLPGVTFLGPEWRELFRHAVKEATRLKLEMGFNLAGGWVMIGPWVTPDNAMKKVVQSELKVRGPAKYRGSLPAPPIVDAYYKDVWVQAFPEGAGGPVDPKAVIDVSGWMKPDGRFEWDVPAGSWVILRTGYTLTGSRWDPYPKGDTFAEGAGYQIDYLNPASLDDHFKHLGQEVLDEAAKAGGHLDYLWSDSWECGKLTWTQDFPAQFLRFRGYDLKPYLPALAGHIVGDADVTARFKEDFDRTVEDCLSENFYGHFAELCHQHGIRMGSEAAGPGNLPPMDSLKNEGRCDLPAGEFWVNGHFDFPGGYNADPYMRLNLKQTASAAHVYGRSQAMAESFTQQERDRTHWSLSPADLKPYVDTAFGEGINSIMLHQATCQPPSDGKPGYEFCAGQHWNPNSTWWEQSPAFFTYLSRCQFMLQQGLFASDVCYYLGDRPPVIAPPKAVDPDLGPGYDYDYANTEVLLTRMSVKDGRIVFPDGLSYRLLVLRNCTSPSPETSKMIGDALSLPVSSIPSRSMPVEAVRKIRDLVRAGATVVGPRPEMASGLKDYPRADDEVRQIADEVWGDCDGKTRTEHRYGLGRVFWGKTPREILAGDGVGPDFEATAEPALARDLNPQASTAKPDPQAKPGAPAAAGGLDYIHRTVKDAEIYFVSNRSGRTTSADCFFRVAGKKPEIWDPISGGMRDAAAFRFDGGRTIVPLDFVSMQSLFVVFRKAASAGAGEKAARNFPALVSVQEIAGGWKVGFDPRWGGPETAEFPELVSWTRRSEEGIKYYSGKATYRKTFDLEPDAAARSKSRLFVDFGAVKAVADVRLNGKELGVLWTGPWRVDITDAVRPKNNALEIDVVNLWANRVIGDLNLLKDKRLTVTHDAFRFDMITKTTSLLDSGLLGPVSILKEADEKETSAPATEVRPSGSEHAAAHDWAAAKLWGEKPSLAGKSTGPVVDAAPPFSFIYGGRRSSDFLASWKLTRSSRVIDRDRLERTLTYADPKTGLEVRCVGVEYEDYPTVEWTVYLRNGGSAKSPLIEDLLAADLALRNSSGAEYLLHHNIGSPCQPNDFQPLETVLGPGAEKRISAAGGRPTNSDMCYFNVEWKGGGVIAAVGWPGQWSSSFRRDKADGLRVCIGQETTHFVLEPGEEARTPLVVLQFWCGDWLRSQNIWRRWMLAHNTPRSGGKTLSARFDACWGNLKPLAAEETAMIDGFVREKIKLDAWILDAGWYPNQEWWDGVGTWTPDPARFPHGMREVAERAHAAGMKFILWFEPERVTMNSWLGLNHPEWLLPRPGGAMKLGPKDSRLLNLGDPRARTWLVDYLDAMFKSDGIDVLRTDFNFDPLPYWRSADTPERQGLTENHYVTGLLAYWDELERRDPQRWIDTCASGGRRLDLETLRRAAPLLRSDYTSSAVAQQAHTYGISLWLPWYGSGAGTDDLYLLRSSICPAWRIGHDMRRTGDNYNRIRREVAGFRAIQDFLLGDYYPLTPYSQDEKKWMVFQFDSPEKGGGAILAYRRSEATDDSRTFKLRNLDRRAIYEVTDVHSGSLIRRRGAELMDEGFPIQIDFKPGAVWLSYKRTAR